MPRTVMLSPEDVGLNPDDKGSNVHNVMAITWYCFNCYYLSQYNLQ